MIKLGRILGRVMRYAVILGSDCNGGFGGMGEL